MPRRDCEATSRATGQPCRRIAQHDSRFCNQHHRIDGPDPVRTIDLAQQRAARKSRNRLTRTLSTMGVPVGDADPIRVYEEQLKVREGDWQYWRTKIIAEGENPSHETHANYLAAGDRLADLARIGITAGIEERRVRVAEAQLVLAAKVIMGVLTHPDIGLSSGQIEKARHLAVQQARMLEAP